MLCQYPGELPSLVTKGQRRAAANGKTGSYHAGGGTHGLVLRNGGRT